MEGFGPFDGLSPTSGISGYRVFTVTRPVTPPNRSFSSVDDYITRKSSERSRQRVDSFPLEESESQHTVQHVSYDLSLSRQHSATDTLDTEDAYVDPDDGAGYLPTLYEESEDDDEHSHHDPLHTFGESQINLIEAAQYESVPIRHHRGGGRARGGLYSIPNTNFTTQEKARPVTRTGLFVRRRTSLALEKLKALPSKIVEDLIHPYIHPTNEYDKSGSDSVMLAKRRMGGKAKSNKSKVGTWREEVSEALKRERRNRYCDEQLEAVLEKAEREGDEAFYRVTDDMRRCWVAWPGMGLF